ncbi:hypothetical protein GCM10011390_27850 [Aureimonas endophytica]|uniref:DUF2867 domain-containing protein n=1 Tax=Aureimonas endophytica TaxID=2027858 RepID=A0A916ZPW3_9HYPH|nr:hypothetical protein [Aureimonas endophytica]GGE07211.1 hypothetical protein GCM10011390_27850 [Aureimonas endophytica]
MALIDRYIAMPQFHETHRLRVAAPPAAVLGAALAYRAESDPLFRRLMTLREYPMRLRQRFEPDVRPPPAFDIDAFILLERNESEVLYGLAGRFWRTDFGLVPVVDAEAFRRLDTPGIAKLCLDFTVAPDGEGKTRLGTETRVICTDAAAWRRFVPYWLLIRPASGLIRRRILAGIGRESAVLPAEA